MSAAQSSPPRGESGVTTFVPLAGVTFWGPALSCHGDHFSREMTMADRKTASIDPQAKILTLINVYEVEPDQQAALAKALSESTESIIKHQPGFVSVCIHSSLDGKKVVNYAQWDSEEHFKAFMRRPETQEQLRQFAAIAKSVAPSLYKLESVIVR